MHKHIQQAKAAGITGFIVSWKDTPTNTRRLRTLVTVASRGALQLSMIYQGLDFDRKPLPAARVAADFVTFAKQFAGNPVFARMGGKPLTIFSGTWAYSHADVARITSGVRPGCWCCPPRRASTGYRRIADVTDGDAYYWSSVNPATNANYADEAQRDERGGARRRQVLDRTVRAGVRRQAGRRHEERAPRGRPHAAHRVRDGPEVLTGRARA